MWDKAPGRPHVPGRYEIRLQGHLDSRWAAWFDGMTLTRQRDGTTVLEGAVVDQAALHGLLGKLRDIGLPLLSVTETDVSARGEPESTDPTDVPVPFASPVNPRRGASS
jgi:hypothetical protein